MTEGGSLVFSVTLDKAVQGAFSVDVGLANGTATGGVDFDNSAVTLNFTGAAGETKQFTVTTTDDAVLEGAETFLAGLSASNGLIDDSDTAIGTIVSESSTKPLLADKLTRNVSTPSSTASSVVVTVNCFVSPAAPVKLSVTAELSKSTPPVAVPLASPTSTENAP